MTRFHIDLSGSDVTKAEVPAFWKTPSGRLLILIKIDDGKDAEDPQSADAEKRKVHFSRYNFYELAQNRLVLTTPILLSSVLEFARDESLTCLEEEFILEVDGNCQAFPTEEISVGAYSGIISKDGLEVECTTLDWDDLDTIISALNDYRSTYLDI